MKKLVAKIGTYEKDGQTKGRYVSIGVIRENDNGEYAILDATVNLAGVLLAQQQMKPDARSVMCSIFTDDFRQQPKPAPKPDDGFSDDIPF